MVKFVNNFFCNYYWDRFYCLINADYYGRQGLVIIKKKDQITLSNPGGFRIDVETAKSGGVSDPRNSALIKMFNLVNIGERAGSGIPNIFSVWKKQGWTMPEFIESFEPDRITLSLTIGKSGDKKVAIKSGDKRTAIKTELQKQEIIEYLTVNVSAKSIELAELIGVKSSRIKIVLKELAESDIIVAEGGNRNRRYRLK